MAAGGLPTGVVTFVFTDVVGSTRLWDAEPDAMSRAMQRHDELVETAVHQAGGQLVRPRGEGDSRFAVFGSPRAAVVAAVELNRRLQSEAWPTKRPVQIRTAMHTGEADLRAGDYYGEVVNRCARLRAIAHPGQILLSTTTRQLAGELGLPQPLALVDLGVHRLKDLSRPERVFQVVHPDLPDLFPTLLSLDRARHNLPVQLSSFVGRETDIAAVKDLLSAHRLVTITGFGGMGKTRLALQVAAELADGDGDGVWLVDLSAETDPDRLPTAIAQTLGISETGEGPAAAVLHDLGSRRLLLVLDNLEQLPEASGFISDLLAKAPGVHVLATSRVPLHIRGEQNYSLRPLEQAGTDGTGKLAEPTSYAAVRLFIDRATEARHGFAVTSGNAATVAAICARLDGHPLSIELAAARIKILSPDALLARLGASLTALSSSGGDRPDRQRTLRATIDWSYNLLPPDEQLLLDSLAVLPGSATLQAVEDVCGPVVRDLDILEGMTALVDKSLVRTHESTDDDGETRFSLLLSIRDYAAEQLEARPFAADVRRRHAEWCRALAVRSSAALEGTADQETAFAALRREIDHLRAALAWSRTNDPSLMLDLVGHLGLFFWLTGALNEGLAWVAAATAGAARDADAARLGDAFEAGAWLAHYANVAALASRYADNCADVRRRLGDQRGLARAMREQAKAASLTGAGPAAIQALLDEAAELSRRTGDDWNTSIVLNNAGDQCLYTGDFEKAYKLCSESLRLRENRGDKWGSAIAGVNVAEAAIGLGRLEDARDQLAVTLPLCRRVGLDVLVGECFAALAATYVDGDPAQAMFCLGVSDAALVGVEEEPGRYEAALRERTVAAARARLSHDEADVAFRRGRAVGVDRAIEMATSAASSSDRRPSPP